MSKEIIELEITSRKKKKIEISLPEFRKSSYGTFYKILSKEKVICVYTSLIDVGKTTIEKAYGEETTPSTAKEYDEALQPVLEYLLNP